MSVRMTVSGAGRFAARLGRLADQIEWELQAAVEEGAHDLRREARDILNVAGHGAPSAPGEAPRRQTGTLRDSLNVVLANNRLSARVGTDLDIGADLEFGTQTMAPRPWLAPAVRAAQPLIQARIEEALRKGIRQAARR